MAALAPPGHRSLAILPSCLALRAASSKRAFPLRDVQLSECHVHLCEVRSIASCSFPPHFSCKASPSCRIQQPFFEWPALSSTIRSSHFSRLDFARRNWPGIQRGCSCDVAVGAGPWHSSLSASAVDPVLRLEDAVVSGAADASTSLHHEDPVEEYIVVNFYYFTHIEDAQAEVERHREFVKDLDLHGRIYISNQGMNAQFSGPASHSLSYARWVQSDPRFPSLRLQVSPSPDGHSFPRLKLRVKPSLVQVDGGIESLPVLDPSAGAVPLTPSQWKKFLDGVQLKEEEEEPQEQHAGAAAVPADGAAVQAQAGGLSEAVPANVLVLDVRNGYEWDVGHFEGAVRPPVDNFRSTKFGASGSEEEEEEQAEEAAEASPEVAGGGSAQEEGVVGPEDPLASADKEKTHVLMYCTGGIRCDVYSTLLRKRGFKNLYTLQGGIANYLKQEGDVHWSGSLFVFDSRLAVPPEHYQVAERYLGGHSSSSSGSSGKSSSPKLRQQATNLAPAAGVAVTRDAAAAAAAPLCALCSERFPTTRHRNCCNVDCNKLFLCCPECATSLRGACSAECSAAPRIRPFLESPGPYQRWHNYRAEESNEQRKGLGNRASRRRQRREGRKRMAAMEGAGEEGQHAQLLQS